MQIDNITAQGNAPVESDETIQAHLDAIDAEEAALKAAAAAAPKAPEPIPQAAMTTTSGQLSLLDFGGFTEPLMVVFRVEDKVSEDGKRQRQTLKIGKRKDIARDLELTRKDQKPQLDAEILRQRDMAKTIMAAYMNRMSVDPNWTGGGMAVTSGKNGKRATFTLITANRPSEITDEKIAAAWGIPMEEVAAFRAKHMKLGSVVEA